MTKVLTIKWLIEEKLIASKQKCPKCDEEMTQPSRMQRSFRWVQVGLSKQASSKRHKQTTSIRKGSQFEESNLAPEEILKYMHQWCQDLNQSQIRQQLGINTNTAVVWDSFCRETCEVTMLQKSEKIGGPAKAVQIVESKVGKRRYHCGHRARGVYSPKIWVGVCGALLKTLTLFQTKICDFPYPISDLT